MNIIEFTDKFQEIETANSFFDQEDAEGLKYWDIVRYQTFSTIYRELINVKLINHDIQKKSWTFQIGAVYTIALNYARFLIISRLMKFKYICFAVSRHKLENNINLDVAANDIISAVRKEALIIETFRRNGTRYQYQSYFETDKIIYTAFLRMFQKKSNFSSISYYCAKVLKDEFSVNTNLDLLMAKLIFNYKIEEKYYYRLLKRITPELIFLTQNGIQKALFSVTKKLNIPTVELQHGYIGHLHPAYAYHPSIKKGQLATLPDFLFIFSEFWLSNFYCPIQNIIPMGNTFYSLKGKSRPKFYELTVIFGEAVALDLISFLKELLKFGFKERICLKIHPNQMDKKERIKEQFIEFCNVEVITNEISIKELLSKSKSILAVHSTTVYEALYNNVKVILYKIKDYHAHKNIFNNPNVYLIDYPQDLIKALNESYIETRTDEFFKEFDHARFESFLRRMTKRNG